MEFIDFDDINFGDKEEIQVEEIKEIKEAKKIDKRSGCYKRKTNSIYRRAFGETQLLDLVKEFKKDYQYNFITAGDVDFLSYLKLILRHQNLEYCLLSTWCMALEDVYQIEEFLIQGKIVNKYIPVRKRKERLNLEMLFEVI